jgi:nucleoside-diphosphate-sugar epimerase
MKILIIGGGGFVGSWLTHNLVSQKNEVVVIDPSIYFSPWDEKTLGLSRNSKKKNYSME